MQYQYVRSAMIALIMVCGATLAHFAVGAEPSVVVDTLDHDADQTLNWSEVEKGAMARLEKLNKDADATRDSKELKGVMGAKAFNAADPNNDRTLSKSEYLALVKKLSAQADADHDGTLDATELSSKIGRHLKLLIE